MAEEQPAKDVPAGATAADVSVKNTTLCLFIESTPRFYTVSHQVLPRHSVEYFTFEDITWNFLVS